MEVVTRKAFVASFKGTASKWAPPQGVRGKWVAVEEVIHGKYEIEGGVFLPCDGGSFHDPYAEPCVVAYGRTPSRARKRLKRALGTMKIKAREDSSTRRFELRRMVREGD